MAHINLPAEASVANCGVSGAITLNNWRVSFYHYLILTTDNTASNLFLIDSGAADQNATNGRHWLGFFRENIYYPCLLLSGHACKFSRITSIYAL